MNKTINKIPLTMIELFSGIGSQKRGTDVINLFDLKVVATSDIEKDAIVSYAAIHNSLTNELVKNYKDYPTEEEMRKQLIDKNIGYDFKKGTNPIARLKGEKLKKYYLAMILSNNLGDISKIDKLPYADFWTYSFPCFVEGTLVLTEEGYKPIEEITCNDYVLTHTNKYQKVVKPMINKANKLYKVDSMISESLYVTGEHPFYIRKRYREWNNNIRMYDRKFEEAQWIKAKDLNRDYYVGTAINQKSELPKWNGSVFHWSDGRKDRYSNILNEKFENKSFWWIIGRYIGDGWIRDSSGIIICCQESEIGQITQNLDNLDFNYSIAKEKSVIKIHIAFKEIGEYCEQFGRGAVNKHLTKDILNLPIDLLQAFLDGYLGADGSFTQNLYKITSVSRELIYGIGQCVAKAYNRPFSIYFTQRPKTCVIEGRTVNQRDTYQITFKLDTNTQDKAFYEGGYIWSPINDVNEYDYDGLVYNLEVENDNSYVVQNIIVHNCQDISVAGNQAGIVKGETRSGLLYEVERLLINAKETNCLPKYLLLENVKNLVGKKFKEQFDEWINTLSDLGFNTYYEVTNAKNCGIPQNRERVFALSIRKDIDTQLFKFAKPYDLGYRLRDFLEDNVDEKYYLSQEIQDRLQITDNTFTKSIIGTTKPDFRTIGQRDLVYQKDGVMGTLVSTDYKQPKQILEEPNELIVVANLKGIMPQFDNSFKTIANVYSDKSISPTIDTMQGGNRQPKILETEHSQWKQEMYDKFIDDSEGEISGVYTNQSKAFGYRPPIKGYSKTLKANANDVGIVENKRVRKLTPKECWRLMGFSDECYDKALAVGLSDSAGYKQAGNSIVTTCISQIMEHLYKAQYDNNYICFDENFTQPQED